jgi:hypothetical protein
MQSFKDKNGFLWDFEITVGSARRVKADCDIDLLNVIEVQGENIQSTVFERLSTDPGLVVDVLYCLCKKEATERNVEPESFAMLFDGETIENASNALVDEIINFSPPMRRRILNAIRLMGEKIIEENERDLNQMLLEQEKELFGEKTIQPLNSSTSVPESSE